MASQTEDHALENPLGADHNGPHPQAMVPVGMEDSP